MTTSETDRLGEVYRQYGRDSAVQHRWNEHNRGNRAILRERRTAIRSVLQEHGMWPLASYTVLEIGCGTGNVLAGLQAWGARSQDLYGIDLLPERIAQARRQHPWLHFTCANAERLGFDRGEFDLVLAFTVFSSILEETMAVNVAHEIGRVLSPTGAVLWYDVRYNNPRNPHVHGLNRAAIRHLFPGFRPHLQTITLLPPLARRLGRATGWLYPLLARLPVLQTHYFGLLVR